MTSYPLLLNNPTPQELAQQLIDIIRGEYNLKGVVWDQETWGATLPRFFDESKHIISHVSASVEELEQQGIHCGTAACVAGHAALSLGGVPVFDTPATGAPEAFHDSKDNVKWSVVKYKGSVVYVYDLAAEALGLNDKQAECLFSIFNTAEEVIETLQQIVEGQL